MSVPFFGANLALLFWGAPFPGKPEFLSRLYVLHVFLLPILIATILAVHLFLVAARHHTQFRENRRTTEKRVVGIPTFPGQAPRSLGLFFAVAAVLFLLGGLVQINPIWLWGPYHVAQGTNGAQPDWYLGWLIGALRLTPGFDVTIGNYTLIPNAFWGGVLFPTLVFLILYLSPWLERRLTGEYGFRNLLDRPRDAPWRTALGAAFFTWVFVIFLAGASDRVFVSFGISYEAQIWVYRALLFVLPVVALLVTRRFALALQDSDRQARTRREAEAEARGELPQPE
jgi:ubiquinol-cytochrome c reductase cytochrome b subunit